MKRMLKKMNKCDENESEWFKNDIADDDLKDISEDERKHNRSE